MRYLARVATIFAVIGVFCCLGFTGCGGGPRADENPDEIPPKPTGMEATSPGPPHSGENPPPGAIEAE